MIPHRRTHETDKVGRAVSLIGVGCSSLCFLALPLLAVWAPASAFGWIHNEALTRSMLIMFLAMSLYGSFRAYRRHWDSKPGLGAALGAATLLAAAWGAAPPVAGWAALTALAASWLWDMRLLRRIEHGCDSNCP